MSADDEILELNDDGEFVVPASKIPKNLDDVPVVKESTSAKISKSVSSGASSVRGSSVTETSDVLGLIASREYKVYAYDSKVDVVIRLETAKETVRSVNVSVERIVTVESSSGARLSVDLGDVQTRVRVEASCATACNFEDYCVISFS